jgi:hypothetical protein
MISELNEQRVFRPRIRSGPRPPEQRQPVVIDGDDLCIGYFSLTAAMISQAELDVRHRCLPSCLTKDDCDRRRLSARRFLRELRTGRSKTIWADWLDLAEARARP